MDRDPADVRVFLRLADYVPPSEPAADVVQRLWARARRIVLGREEKPAVEDDRLRMASRARIDDLTASPDCSALAAELDATLAGWLADDSPFASVRLIVTPPCDVRDLLGTWARREGHEILAAPARDTLLERGAACVPELDGDDVLVVPHLDEWFLRHRHGLASVRELLARLAASERRCLIGCGSWAWRFLERAADANLLLPEPLVFAPFDANRLAAWLVELADEGGTREALFRESRTGVDVFARDGDGELESDFLEALAARSRGIPWVAWQLWQRGLRTVREEDHESSSSNGGDAGHGVGGGSVDGRGGRDGGTRGDGGSGDGEGGNVDDVLWLVRPDEFVLPYDHERASRLVLHALLVHGALDIAALGSVLPLVGESNVVPALIRAGHVERVGERYRCVPAAYPHIFDSLQTAGFSVPRI